MKCWWCGKDNRRPSDYEQESLRDGSWQRLCVRCANRRLDNPWGGLLPMRKVQTAEEAARVLEGVER